MPTPHFEAKHLKLSEGEVRSQSTFFPEEGEQAALRNLNFETFMSYRESQPEMTGRFLHELWRTGQDDLIAKRSSVSLFLASLIYQVEAIENELIAFKEVLLSDEAEFTDFLVDLFTAISNGYSDRDYNAELPDNEVEWLNKVVMKILE